MKARDSRSGGVLFGLMLSALVFVCLITAFGIFMATHVRVVSRDRGGAHDVSIDLPGGHLSVRAHDHSTGKAVTGVPVYPGARPEHDSGGDATFEWSSTRGGKDKDFAVSASGMVTDDSVEQVADFYRKQLPNWIFESGRNGNFHMELQEGGYKRIIEIHDEHGRTHIGVASVGEPASN